MKQLRIALAQIDATVGDFVRNGEKIIECSVQAAACGADVVVFPELAMCGYPPEDLLLKPHFIRDAQAALHRVISDLPDIVAIIGCVEAADALPAYNAAAIVQNRRVFGYYRKMELPNYGVFDERRHFRGGRRTSVIHAAGICFGVTICEDIWVPDGPAAQMVRKGAQLIINLSASPYYCGKHARRRELVRGRARELAVPFCYVNLVGGQDELVFDGGSFICDRSGRIQAQARQFAPGVLCADIALPPCRRQVRSAGVSLQPFPSVSKPPLRPQRAAALSRTAETYQALVLGTADYVRKNGFEKVVVGLSGGVDSALVAAIAVDALGPSQVKAVTMPSRYTAAQTRNDAVAVAENLAIELLTIPIEPVVAAYGGIFETLFQGRAADATEENIQARIRGNLLMALSNKFGWLVLTTGNKSETSVGYCTLYGDMAGGFSVIKDVPKMTVYALCRYRNRRAGSALIPESVLLRPPSAELKPGQTDQDSLPPYPVLDAIVQAYVEQDKSYDEIRRSLRVPAAVLKDVIGKIDRNEYKRRQAPPGIKISPKAFGRDRRMPITNRYRQFD